jgi:hypothetical protein
LKYRGVHYRSVAEFQIANRIRWEKEDMRIGNSTLDYTPVNLGISNMCAGETARLYTVDDLQEELNKWRGQVDIWAHAHSSDKAIAERALKNCYARIAALSEAIRNSENDECETLSVCGVQTEAKA